MPIFFQPERMDNCEREVISRAEIKEVSPRFEVSKIEDRLTRDFRRENSRLFVSRMLGNESSIGIQAAI